MYFRYLSVYCTPYHDVLNQLDDTIMEPQYCDIKAFEVADGPYNYKGPLQPLKLVQSLAGEVVFTVEVFDSHQA